MPNTLSAAVYTDRLTVTVFNREKPSDTELSNIFSARPTT